MQRFAIYFDEDSTAALLPVAQIWDVQSGALVASAYGENRGAALRRAVEQASVALRVRS